MQIDPSIRYEVHKALIDPGAREAGEKIARLVLLPEQFEMWWESRDRAKTAGPLVMGGHISVIPGDKIAEIYEKALREGARPCRIEENGQVLMGEYVFVPALD